MEITTSELKKETIIQTVYGYFGVDSATKSLKSRKRVDMIPRQISMYLLRNMVDRGRPITWQAIGELFDRDYSSVWYSHETVSDMIDTDKNFRAQVQEIEQLLKN